MTNIIAESELILNKDGSVYHLNLLPEEIADTIITVGDQDRVAEVSKYFDSIEVKKNHREFVTHTGFINNKRISVISTGIGTDNIDIVINELDALVNIDLKTRTIKDTLKSLNIIRIGTCGGLQAFLDVDSFVVSKAAFGLDNLLHNYAINKLNNSPSENWNKNLEKSRLFDKHLDNNSVQSYYVSGAENLIEVFSNKPSYNSGLTVTCSGFYGPQGRILRLNPAVNNFIEKLQSFKIDDNQILNFEMETSGIYALGKLMNHNCCSLSVVVANRIKQKFSSNAANSVDKLIRETLETLVQ